MKNTVDPFFFSSQLLYSDKTIERLKNATIAIAGVGGVGAIAIELLVRNGIIKIKVADPDVYESKNLNRQIFSTIDVLGKNKATTVSLRLKEINPDLNVEVYEEGVSLLNIHKFCKDVDVLLCMVDRESIKIIINRVAKKYHIPVVMGSRYSISDHRWKVGSQVWDYKNNPHMKCYDDKKHPEFAAIKFKDLTENVLIEFDKKIMLKKNNYIKNIVKENPTFFGNIKRRDLITKLESLSNYNSRDVNSVIANTSGCFSATSALKLLLEGPSNDIVVDLWNGR